jgi:hypothetical protein
MLSKVIHYTLPLNQAVLHKSAKIKCEGLRDKYVIVMNYTDTNVVKEGVEYCKYNARGK